MLIGYARVSTIDQTLDLQKDALRQAGCDRIFTDTASGAKAERVGLDEALSYVRQGDTLTQAGLTAARARGRKGGRPKALNPKKAQIAGALYNDKNNTIDEIC